jgi:predicted HicB family RNase H-like nuclease
MNKNKGYEKVKKDKLNKKFLVLTNEHIFEMLQNRAKRDKKSVNSIMNKLINKFIGGK